MSATVDGGEQDVRGAASNTVIENGGSQFIETSGLASGTIVSSGGNVDVRAGGRTIQTVILAGGAETVEGFGIDSNSHVSGGTIDIYGSVAALVIDSGGTAIVHDGGNLGPGTSVEGELAFDLTGADSFQGPFSGSGALALEGGGSLVLAGGDAFTGTVTISSGTLELTSSTAAGSGRIGFGSVGGGVLKIDGTTMPANTITGLRTGDEIDLAAVVFSPTGTVAVATGNKLQVVSNGTTYVLQLDPTATSSLAGG
jgi:autotransporter passenger strand-loop-strand repeat protein/autotransporter-associated beta strand protein